MIQQDLQIGQFLEGMTHLKQGKTPAAKDSGEFLGMMRGLLASGNMKDKGEIAKVSSEDLDGATGKRLIENFRKYLLSKGFKLDQTGVDENGLLDFGKILMAAGFDKKSVESLLDSFKGDATGRFMKLSDLFLKASELDETTDGSEGLFDISALPFIESILGLLGIEQEKVKELLSDAKIEGQGIDIRKLISNLKKALANTPGKEQSGETGLSMAQSDNQIRSLLDSIDMSGDGDESDTLTLEKMIARLETILAKKNGTLAGRDNIVGDVNKFMSKLYFEKETESPKDIVKTTLSEAIKPDGKTILLSPLVSKNVKNTALDKQEGRINLEQSSVAGNQNRIQSAADLNAKEGFAKGSQNHEAFGKLNDSILKANNGSSDKTNETSFSLENIAKEAASGEKTLAASNSRASGRTLPSYVLDQVSRQIFRSVQQGENEIRIQLKPPQLGRLQLSIQSTNNGYKVGIITEQLTTKEMLLSNSNELKTLLVDQGIKLDKVDVQFSSNFDQTTANAKRENGSQNNRKRRKFHMEGMDQKVGSPSWVSDEHVLKREGRVNLVA